MSNGPQSLPPATSAKPNGHGDQTVDVRRLQQQILDRFGVLPNFFRLAPETPEINQMLWDFAQSAYLDNPLPSIFKERLFVHLSRFCAARYCVARHVGFLLGLGRTAGDGEAAAHRVEDVVQLLQRPVSRGPALAAQLAAYSDREAPLGEMPGAGSPDEEVLFAFATQVFLQTPAAQPCLETLEILLGGVRLQYLLLFLAFVRAGHYWTKVHPEIEFEDDIKDLLATHEALADCILHDPEANSQTVTQAILDELPVLRQKADAAVGLLGAIVDSSEDAIVSKTLEGVITSWNRGAERLFGYSAAEAVGQNITIIVPTDRLDEESNILARVKRGESIEHFDTVRRRKNGTTLDIALTISPVRDAAGKIVGASKIAHDISGPKLIEHELRESDSRFRKLAGALDVQVQFRTEELQRRNAEVVQQSTHLHELSTKLMQAQDEERRRIARDLHDSVGQTLAALGMTLQAIQTRADENAPLAKSIDDAQDMVRAVSQEIRTASYLLHPPLLDEGGLALALRWYISGLIERSDLKIELNIPEDLGRLAAEIELASFRLVQECLTNVHRHSGSKTAEISVHRGADQVSVEVRDHGKGISKERLAEIQSKGIGLGIRGMSERIRQCGGKLTVDSNALGTKVVAIFPAGVSSANNRLMVGSGLINVG